MINSWKKNARDSLAWSARRREVNVSVHDFFTETKTKRASDEMKKKLQKKAESIDYDYRLIKARPIN